VTAQTAGLFFNPSEERQQRVIFRKAVKQIARESGKRFLFAKLLFSPDDMDLAFEEFANKFNNSPQAAEVSGKSFLEQLQVFFQFLIDNQDGVISFLEKLIELGLLG